MGSGDASPGARFPIDRGQTPNSWDPVLNLDEVYARRFTDGIEHQKDAIWQPIARYLQRFIAPEAAVLDIGCDRGHFIRNIRAREKWATDIRDMRQFLPENIHFRCIDGLQLGTVLPRAHFDAIFMSNYLEHLPSSDAVVEQLWVARELVKPGGRVIILQPNIRLIGSRYWDFIDHKVALTRTSLLEATALAGLSTERVITRFLPYTTKSRLPRHPALVSCYLAFQPAWWLLGKQTLYVGSRPV
jgi:2-polyprenyl-3-methyl-5-hydroxy-6-metoxy-1,4-benzoquinol methylase